MKDCDEKEWRTSLCLDMLVAEAAKASIFDEIAPRSERVDSKAAFEHMDSRVANMDRTVLFFC